MKYVSNLWTSAHVNSTSIWKYNNHNHKNFSKSEFRQST